MNCFLCYLLEQWFLCRRWIVILQKRSRKDLIQRETHLIHYPLENFKEVHSFSCARCQVLWKSCIQNISIFIFRHRFWWGQVSYIILSNFFHLHAISLNSMFISFHWWLVCTVWTKIRKKSQVCLKFYLVFKCWLFGLFLIHALHTG